MGEEPKLKDIRQEVFYTTFCEISDWLWAEFSKLNGIHGPIADQITRSIDSVGANLTEGWARGSNESVKAVLQFFRYALGSAYESLYWLDRSISRGIINRTKGLAMHKSLEATCGELRKYMDGLVEIELKRKK